MITASVMWDADSARKLEKLSRVDARLFRRARGRAANAAKRALFSTIRRHGNPKYGVAKLAKRQGITVATNGGKPSDVFGRFSSDERYLVAYIRGDEQVIGWADRLHGFLSALQDASDRDFNKHELKRFYAVAKANGRKANIPASYHRPARPVIDPFAESMRTVYPSWIVANFEKMYAKKVGAK